MATETDQSEFDRELLSAYVDGELTAAERAAVEARLAGDAAARRQVEEFRRLSGLIQNLPQPALPADFSAKIMDRANQLRPAPVELARPGFSIGRTWRGWFWAGAALAAALLIAVMLPDERPELADRGEAVNLHLKKEVPQLRAPRAAQSEDQSQSERPQSESPQSGEQRVESQMASGRVSFPESSPSEAQGRDDSAAEQRLDEPELLIVRVSMPPEALKGRALDQLLAKNGIDVETTDQERLREESRQEPSLSTYSGAAGRLAKEAAPEGGLGGERPRPDAPLDSTQSMEVIEVEAPIEQVAASLASIQGDAENFFAVEIEEPAPLSELELKSDRDAPWQRYNRAATTDREIATSERAADAPASVDELGAESDISTATSELKQVPTAGEASPSPADSAAAPATPKAAITEGISPDSNTLGLGGGRGKARYLSADWMKRELESLARTRAPLKDEATPRALRGGGAGGETQQMRVLFVLQAMPAADAAPAAIKAAEPTKPPR